MAAVARLSGNTAGSSHAPLTHLDAAAAALAKAGKPMSAKELAELVRAEGLVTITGETPWKTITARLSQDIREHGDRSRFKRTYHGRFALQAWTWEPEFQVRRRQLNPLDETIKAVPIASFKRIASAMASGEVDPGDFRILVANAIDIDRRKAEDTKEFVQLIPTFVVRDRDRVLTYRRTKRLPEARLHHARCVNFGGHMQADDAPSLFWNDDDIFSQFLHRELYEELSFAPPPWEIAPSGLLYLQGNDFERQHVGLTFTVMLNSGTEVDSLEPGMHTDLRFVATSNLKREVEEFDSWSRVIIRALDEFA